MIAQRQATSGFARFATHDPSVAVREITKVLVGIWTKDRPKNPRVASKRAKVMSGQADPIGCAYLITLGALDEGKPLEVAIQWAKDLIASATQYAERQPQRGLGVLPFEQIHQRLTLSAIREDAEADSAETLVDEDCIASLENARAERMEAIAADQRKVEAWTARIAFLRAR